VRTFVVSILFLLSLDIFAEGTQPTKFQWKWSDNQILELNEYHDVFFRVGNRSVSREDRNRVLLKTSKCDNLGCQVSAWFDTYIRFGKTEGPFQKDKKFDSQFTIFRNGKYEVPDEYVMPNLRSFPTFPDTELNVGDSWKLPAEESFDFSGERIKIAVEPEYSYLGKDKWQFQKESGFTDKISYTYPIFYDNRDKKPRKGNVPNKIFGFARGVVYFDSKKGLPEYKEVKLSYTFILPDGTLQEASYDIQGIYHTRRSLNTAEKDKFTEDVLKDLIVGDISQPNPLNSEILKKHSEREIRVSGHTDNVGKKDYNLKLSEDRAKSVLNELVDKHKLDDRKISFHGYGDSVPVVPNDTEENRAKNRRVEITLILD